MTPEAQTDLAGSETTPPDEANVKDEKAKPKRTATRYIVLVEDPDNGVVVPISAPGEQADNPREFEGFRREDVLADVIAEELVTVGEDGTSPWVRIVPARGYVRLRGREPQRRVVAESG